MSVVGGDQRRLVEDRFGHSEDISDAYRCALYYQVVKAILPNHGITDDDPERAVRKALATISGLANNATAYTAEGVEVVEDIQVRAQELYDEVSDE